MWRGIARDGPADRTLRQPLNNDIDLPSSPRHRELSTPKRCPIPLPLPQRRTAPLSSNLITTRPAVVGRPSQSHLVSFAALRRPSGPTTSSTVGARLIRNLVQQSVASRSDA
ncbi:uncharacterized protein BKA78DRAFT_173025 [Phyllosticta capitalensis]|uniref:uncharacterized protein n=1 Tax=Phyllosticta capitalensis TaxID=121624 RepID=UPI00312D9C20